MREGGGINRAIAEGREVIQSRGKEKAGRQGHRAWKTHREPFSDEERSTRVHTESGEEEEEEEKGEPRLQDLTDTTQEEEEREGKLIDLIWSECF